uniref:Uncharacterized protein n=1 Tax=Anguilla anguilla TaxID=7936 RepID=A0A0E9UHY9_ANGAN
MNPFLQKGSAS